MIIHANPIWIDEVPVLFCDEWGPEEIAAVDALGHRARIGPYMGVMPLFGAPLARSLDLLDNVLKPLLPEGWWA